MNAESRVRAFALEQSKGVKKSSSRIPNPWEEWENPLTFTNEYYLQNAFRNRNKTVLDCLLELEGEDFDAIAFTGVSGALIAPIIAYLLQKPVIVIRKDGVKSHSDFTVEGCSSAENYVFIDDCIDTEETLRRVMDEIYLWSGAEIKFVLRYGTKGCFPPNKIYHRSVSSEEKIEDFAFYDYEL